MYFPEPLSLSLSRNKLQTSFHSIVNWNMQLPVRRKPNNEIYNFFLVWKISPFDRCFETAYITWH